MKLPGLKLAQVQQALAILWYHDEQKPDVAMTSGQVSKIIKEMGLGNPHSTQLGGLLKKSGAVLSAGQGFRLKAIARSQIRDTLKPILGATQPEIDQELGYLPRDVWKNTRGYIERVCEQLNGCYQLGYYDAASVMMRRVLETLIIEAYEKLQRDSQIRDPNGQFFMLKDLIAQAVSGNPVGLGRDAKDALIRIKELGDRSAHNRRYNAVRSDLDRAQSGFRVAVDELVNIASLRSKF